MRATAEASSRPARASRWTATGSTRASGTARTARPDPIVRTMRVGRHRTRRSTADRATVEATIQASTTADADLGVGADPGMGQRVASAARAAASIAATGASTPVQRAKARAAWKTSIERPPWASIPRRRSAAIQAVSAGW